MVLVYVRMVVLIFMEIIKLIFNGIFHMVILLVLVLHNIKVLVEEYGLLKMVLYKIHPPKSKELNILILINKKIKLLLIKKEKLKNPKKMIRKKISNNLKLLKKEYN